MIQEAADRLAQNHISTRLLEWWDQGHAKLPWRADSDPYATWIAEVMLQQTQIASVMPYYQRWMERFPTVEKLASSSLDNVLKMWEGLGYYSRARNLHAAARTIVDKFNGTIPDDVDALMSLPGIGRYTAGAIASIAFGRPEPLLDGNIVRVFTRLIDLAEDINRSATRSKLWRLAERLVPAKRPGDYNQALMELGQTVCRPKSPNCAICPLNSFCLANIKQIQEERPVRSSRKKIPHFDVVAAIIWQKARETTANRFLITQRPLDGLLGGMWEFPGGKQEEAESLTQALRREIYEELNIEIAVNDKLTTVKHAYTHFKITLHAFQAQYQGGKIQNIGVLDHAWVTLKDLDKFAFAAADRQVINELKKSLSVQDP